METWLEAEAPRVACPEHGVLVAQVPWARHWSRFTASFEDTGAWLVTRMTVTAGKRLRRHRATTPKPTPHHHAHCRSHIWTPAQ